MTSQKAPTKDEKLLSAIGYLGVLCIVPLILKRKSAYAQHHGKQGLVILIAWLILWVGNIIPILGQIVWVLGSFALLILVILGVINAFNGRMWKMPYLGSFAKKFKF